jgi:hypothetical protein
MDMKKISGLAIIFSLLANITLQAVSAPITDASFNFQISSLTVNPSGKFLNKASPEIMAKSNFYTIDKKNLFSEKLSLPAYKVGEISFKTEPEPKKQFIKKFLPGVPEIPQWAIITGSAALFIGSVVVSQLKPKTYSEKFKNNFQDSNSFSIAGNNKGRGYKISKFNIEFKF